MGVTRSACPPVWDGVLWTTVVAHATEVTLRRYCQSGQHACEVASATMPERTYSRAVARYGTPDQVLTAVQRAGWLARRTGRL